MGQGGRAALYSNKRVFSMAGEETKERTRRHVEDDTPEFIEHSVTKLDTLAGIAIKYGIEVADVKRLNGLTTDIQMFARKTLWIPVSRTASTTKGHQSSSAANGYSYKTPDPPPRLGRHSYSSSSNAPFLCKSDGRDSDPSSIGSSIGLLRGYYGLASSSKSEIETEMCSYNSSYQAEDNASRDYGSSSDHARQFGASLPETKSKSAFRSKIHNMMNTAKELVINEVEKANEHLVRRRTKADGTVEGTDLLPKSDPGVGEKGSGRVPRPKTSSKVVSELDFDSSSVRTLFNPSWKPTENGIKGLGITGKTVEDLISKIKKSSSTSNLQEDKKLTQVNGMHRNGSRGDLIIMGQGTSQGITVPLLEGLKPTSSWRSKAALD